MENFNSVPSSVEKQPQMIRLDTLAMEFTMRKEGVLYKRKIENIRGAEEVKEEQVVETRLPDGTLESSVEAKTGDWIITGAKGEKFVFTSKKFNDLYVPDNKGGYLPKERKIIALKNPTNSPVKILAPWSTKEKPAYQEGSEKCFFVAGLDDLNNFTNDRYLIGDEELLLSNYVPLEKDTEINPNKLRKLLDNALVYGENDDLEKLFDAGMSVDQEDFEGRTALQMKSARGDKKGVEMLLARGASINKTFMHHGRNPRTALDAAIETNRREIEELLRSHGAKRGEEIMESR